MKNNFTLKEEYTKKVYSFFVSDVLTKENENVII